MLLIPSVPPLLNARSNIAGIRSAIISRLHRFRYRTRYFSDYGIIGSKEFVSKNYQRLKDIFQSEHEKKPKPIKGLDGMYSLKRLSEA